MPRSPTPASQALRALSARQNHPITQERIAAALETKQTVVSRWASGQSRPCAFLRTRIERVFGIPADDWFTDEERRKLSASAPYPTARGCSCAAA